jgi:chromosome segregation ATPase
MRDKIDKLQNDILTSQKEKIELEYKVKYYQDQVMSLEEQLSKVQEELEAVSPRYDTSREQFTF